jgi:hypothetical protein
MGTSMLRDGRAPARGDGGGDGAAATVEFAIVFPFVVFIVAAFVSVASFIIQYEHLNSAARESARFAALSQSTTEAIRARALDAMPVGGFDATPVVEVFRQRPDATTWEGPLAGTVRPCNQLSDGESRVRVELAGTVRSDTPLLSRVALTLRTRGVYRCE